MNKSITINGIKKNFDEAKLFQSELDSMNDIQFLEIWVSYNEKSICALVNGDRAWLMYLRESGDAGFHTENPSYGSPDEMIEYELSNGQVDEYPSCMTYQRDEVFNGLISFIPNGIPSKKFNWMNDSFDGQEI